MLLALCFLLLLNQFAVETNRVLPYKTWLFGRGYDPLWFLILHHMRTKVLYVLVSNEK